MQNKISSIITLILLVLSLVIIMQGVSFCSAEIDNSFPILSMPVEYVNYTIDSFNGSLRAMIDGEYPITIQNQFNGDLPMVYPMPPGTSNIRVTLDEQELGWSNFTQSNPDALHQTAIGDWWMIYSVLPNISGSFSLKIHYEHPLETVNASHLFLYDLNISPYLSEQNQNSTAYFTVRIQTEATNLRAYTAPPTSTASEWKPIGYKVTTQGNSTIVSITMYSQYSELLGKPLPGDLVVEFSAGNQPSAFPLLIIAVFVVIITILLLTVLFYFKKQNIQIKLGAKLLFFGYQPFS
jgi:hypothetical protein